MDNTIEAAQRVLSLTANGTCSHAHAEEIAFSLAPVLANALLARANFVEVDLGSGPDVSVEATVEVSDTGDTTVRISENDYADFEKVERPAPVSYVDALLSEAEDYAKTSVMRGMGSASTSANWICRLATALRERGEQLAKAQAKCDSLSQTSGDLCPRCNWRGVRDEGCEFCQLHDAKKQLAEVTRERDAATARADAFKAYVHKRLDDAGIPSHPDGPHSKEGCRVGDRLDIALCAENTTAADLAQGVK